MKWIGLGYLALAVATLEAAEGDWQAQAVAAVRDGRPQEAIELYQTALEADPTDQVIRRDLMWLFWEQDDYAECAKHAEFILAGSPDDLESVELAARSRHRLKDYDAALAHYQKALSLRPSQLGIELDIVRIHETRKDYSKAYDMLQAVLREHGSPPETWPILARLLEVQGRFSEAADAWSQASLAYPDVTDYAYRQARALHFAGREEECSRQLTALLESNPDHSAAREFLVRMALVDGRLQEAIDWYAGQPWDDSAGDVPRLLRLAALQGQAGNYIAAVSTLARALELAPEHSEALVMQAEDLQALGRWTESIELCVRAVELHPSCIRAWLTLANGYEGLGNRAEAVRSLEAARALDPTSPSLLLRQAQALYLADKKQESRALLEAWLEQNSQEQVEVPVLLYHGLAASSRDPMLASRIHMTTKRFEEQLNGLREAGYQTITIDQLVKWLRGAQRLPENSVVITFDDGRLDSLREAEPVLKRTGFGAVMFVAGINADRNLTGYASWDELNSFKATGRWELQSHGDRASLSIPVNSEGLTGNFLANRQWLVDEGRMESTDDWETRIREDYLSILQKLGDFFSVHPKAHAWPEGNYGQQAYVNTPLARERNLALVRKLFSLGFQQSGSGVNPRSRDPILLERLEPEPGWSGAEIVAQMRGRSPTVMILQGLLQQALWDREPDQAAKWLKALAAHGVGENALRLDEARVAIMMEDYQEAERKVRQYLSSNADLDPARQADAWNLIATARYLDGDYASAAQAYQKSLLINSNQPQAVLDLATVYEASRQYDRALELCLELRRVHPNSRKVLPTLGRLYDGLDQPQQSRVWWSLAAKAYPHLTDYSFRAERARYAAGDHPTALTRLNELLKQHPEHNQTRQFLVQCALVRGNVDEAMRLLKECQLSEDCNSTSISLQVARLYVQKKESAQAATELRKLLQSDPVNGEARLLLAECLRLGGDPEESIRMFSLIVDENRASRRAWLGMADAWLELGQPEKSVEAVRELRRTAPDDPYLTLREADYLYSAGCHEESEALLGRWLESNHSPPLPVLRYHGLATDPADPMLAQRVNHTVAAFADHMEKLHKAGYQTVNAADVAAWYLGKAELPAHAVVITFDDGRLDSLRQADPILALHGYQAVMFADGHNASRNLPGYATWDELRRYRKTGRWDVQSKGTLSSTQVPIDAEGRTDRFLVSLKWDDRPGRLETELDWKARVTEEHESTVLGMQEHFGVKPIAFAWPDGDYGQEGVPNYSEAAANNPVIARQYYQLGFGEDGSGLNLPSADSMRISRVSPRPGWSGEDLVRHLQDEDPIQRVIYQLLRYAAWQGRIHEGYRWLEELQRAGASPSRMATAEALLRTMAGDPGHAMTLLADDGRQDQLSQETLSLQKSIERQVQPRVRLWLDGWVDSDDRYTIAGHLGGGAHVMDNTRIQLDATLAEYHHENVATLSEAAAEVSVEQQLNAFHQLTAQLGGHLFEAPAEDAISFAARWDASWSDKLRTGLAADYQPGYTVEMLLENINYYRAIVDGAWTPRDDLRIRLVGRYWAYTDDNNRIDLAAQAAYELPWVDNLQAVYRLTLADTRLDQTAYYTPQQLIQNQLGLDYLWKASDDVSWRLRYLPGYGVEEGKDGRFVHAVHTDLLIRNVLTLDVRPSVDFQQTPTYQMFRFLLMFEKSF